MPIHTYAPKMGENGIKIHTPYFPYRFDQVSALCSFRFRKDQRDMISSKVDINTGIGMRFPRMLMRAPDKG